jgi:hypothetical protein
LSFSKHWRHETKSKKKNFKKEDEEEAEAC